MKTTKTATEIIQKRKDEKIVRIKDALTKESYKPTSTGLQGLDNLLGGGLRAGDLMVLSGRSGNGKTTVGINLMRNLMDLNPVLFSYEVLVDRLYEKICNMLGTDDPNIFTPKKNVSGDIGWINDRILEAITRYNSKFVVIDHLDFITTEHKSDDGRRNEISSIMGRLKTMAVEKGLIILLQVHVKKGENNRSPLGNNDLADSRSIANLADFVMFVNRELDEDNIAVGNSGMLLLTKNRYNGQQGKVEYTVNNLDKIVEL